MNLKQADKIARLAIDTVAVSRPVTFKDKSMLFVNSDGTFRITYRGIYREEMDKLDKDQAVQIIVNNLADD